ncbi:MAG: histidinol-phosphate transaminase [Actinomycetota bacterium]|nr:histidinol-phosphate transaminase [Actinomycetota bacterium]
MNDTRVHLRPEIVALAAYRQGRAARPDGFKLSSNENPHDPLPAVLDAIAQSSINRYPDAGATVLRGRLAEKHGVAPEQVHVGAGSVSILAQLITAAAGPGDEVVFSWRSFEAYPGLVVVAGATAVPVQNRADAGHDLDAMAAAVTERTRLVLLCSPNNPTSTVITRAEFDRFMARIPRSVLVLLDEAYIEFVEDGDAVDGIPLLPEHPNLVVLRTFSKAYGLAGLRVGYAVGPSYVLDAARSAAIPLSVTEPAQRAALASLDHEDELLERVRRINRTRDRVWRGLEEQGWRLPKPHGNFVWLATGEHTDRVTDRFADAGLVVRGFSGEGIRVSIGEESSVETLLRVAGEVVRSLAEPTQGGR